MNTSRTPSAMPNISMMQPSLIRSLSAFAPFIAADGENYVAEEEAIEATAYWLNRSAKEG